MKSFCWMAAVLLCAASIHAGELQKAAAAGDLSKVRALLQANPQSAKAREAGTTALHEAARAGHLDVVKLLVSSGADVNSRDISGLTPLRLALGHRRLEVAEFLKKSGGLEQAAPPARVASPASPVPQSQPLFIPAPPVVRQPPVSSPSTPTLAGQSPVPAQPAIPNGPAAETSQQPSVVAPLTDRELLPGTYPIHELARVGDVEQIKVIYKTAPDIVDATDEHGFTALHVAAANRQLAVAQTLIALRAKVNVKAENEQTPLHAAARNGDAAIAGLLITNRAIVDARDNLGQTPLLLLLQSASAAALESAGSADAAARMQGDMKEAMARARASVLARNEGVVNLLLRAGADPNVTDRLTGRTALHVAAGLGHTPLVEALVRHRANVNALDARGKTPLCHALRQEHTGVISALRAAGGNVGPTRLLSATEQGLVDFHLRTEQALQRANGSEKAKVLISLNPTEADCKRMFPKHAATAWKVVEQINRQIREAFARPLPDAERGKEIWRVLPELPSAIVQDWRARGALSTDLPVFSLRVEKVGATTRPGDYCFVNGHWVMVPPLRNIAAQMAAAEPAGK